MIITNEKDRIELINRIQAINLEKQSWEISAKPYKKNRSAAQNNIVNVWYRDRAKQTENDVAYERNTLKLNLGIPILCRRPEFSGFWEPFSKMDYDFQLKAMENIDVTSKMKTDEMTEYLYAIEELCYSEGIHLTKPQMYSEAIGN